MPKSRPPPFPRRQAPPAFRRQMVELVRTERTPEELAREFEPTAQAIRNWVAQAKRDEGPPVSHGGKKRPALTTGCQPGDRRLDRRYVSS